MCVDSLLDSQQLPGPTEVVGSLAAILGFLEGRTELSQSELKSVSIAMFAVASWYDSILPIALLTERFQNTQKLFGMFENQLRTVNSLLDVSYLDSLEDPALRRLIDLKIIQKKVAGFLCDMMSEKSTQASHILSLLDSAAVLTPLFTKRMVNILQEESIATTQSGLQRIIDCYLESETMLADHFKKNGIDPYLSKKKELMTELALSSDSLTTAETLLMLVSAECMYGCEMIDNINDMALQIDKTKDEKSALIAKSGDQFPDMVKMNALYEQFNKQTAQFLTCMSDLFTSAFDVNAMRVKIDEARKEEVTAAGEYQNLLVSYQKRFGLLPEPVVEPVDVQAHEQDPLLNNVMASELVAARDELAGLYEHNALVERQLTTLEEKLRVETQKTLSLQDGNDKLKAAQLHSRSLSDGDIDALRVVVSSPAEATPEMLLNVYSILYKDKLVVLPNAYRTAKKSSTFKYTDRLAGHFNTLMTSYLDAISNGQPDTQAREVFGRGVYSAKESESVQLAPTLRCHREFEVNGKKVLMLQHLSIGVAESLAETIRVYFKIIEGVVYIGHCGEHLPTSQF